MAYYKNPNVEALYDIVNKHNVKSPKKTEELKQKFRDIMDQEVKDINIPSRRTFTFSNHSHLLNVALKRSQWATDLVMEYKQDIQFLTANNPDEINYQVFLTLAAQRLSLEDLQFFMAKSHNLFVDIQKKKEEKKDSFSIYHQDYILKETYSIYIDLYYVQDKDRYSHILHNASRNKDLRVFQYLLEESNLNFKDIPLNIEMSNIERTDFMLTLLKNKFGNLNIKDTIGFYNTSVSQDVLIWLIEKNTDYFYCDVKEKHIDNLLFLVEVSENCSFDKTSDICTGINLIFNKIKSIKKYGDTRRYATEKIDNICVRLCKALKKKDNTNNYTINFLNKEHCIELSNLKLLLDNHFHQFHLIFEKKHYNDLFVEANPEAYSYLFSDRKLDIKNEYFQEKFLIDGNKTNIPLAEFMKTLIKSHNLSWTDLNLDFKNLCIIYKHSKSKTEYFDKIDLLVALMDLFKIENLKTNGALVKEFEEKYKELTYDRHIYRIYNDIYSLNSANSPYLSFLMEPELKEKIIECGFSPKIILHNIFKIELESIERNDKLSFIFNSLEEKKFTIDEFVKYAISNLINDYINEIDITEETLTFLDTMKKYYDIEKPLLTLMEIEKHLIYNKLNHEKNEEVEVASVRKRL